MSPTRPPGPRASDRSRALADAGEWLARSGYGARWSTDEPPPPELWHAFVDALCTDGRSRGLRAACDLRLRDACMAPAVADVGPGAG